MSVPDVGTGPSMAMTVSLNEKWEQMQRKVCFQKLTMMLKNGSPFSTLRSGIVSSALRSSTVLDCA